MSVHTRNRALLLAAALILALGCSTPSEQGTDLADQDLGGPDLATQDEVLDSAGGEGGGSGPTPKLIASLDPPPEGFAPCPGTVKGWCMASGKKVEIIVRAKVFPSEFGGIDAIEEVLLTWESPGEGLITIDSTKLPVQQTRGTDGYFRLLFNPDVIAPGAVNDGLFSLRVQVVSSVVSGSGGFALPLTKTLPASVLVDRTPPQLTLFAPKAEGAKYVKTLDSRYCIQDLDGKGEPGAGVVAEGVSFMLGGKPITPEPAEDLLCPKSKAVIFDVGRNDTETTIFTVVVTDRAGNSTEVSREVRIVGLPHYELPPGLLLPSQFSGLVATRSVHLALPDQLPPDPYPDLLLIAPEALALAVNNGKGLFDEARTVVSGPALVDAFALDVNQDGATDLVVLRSMAGDTVSQLELYLQDAKAETDEEGEIVFYTPLGTFPAQPSEAHLIEAAKMNLLRQSDINLDGRPDFVLAGPDDVLCAALFLHTGAKVPYGPPPEDSKLTFFNLHDTLQGSHGITDLSVGYFREKGAGELPTPELVFLRPTEGLLTTVTIENDFRFGIGVDTLYCWGSAEKAARRPDLEPQSTDIYDDVGDASVGLPGRPDIEDLVVYSSFTKGLHFVPSKGNGYFVMKANQYKAKLKESWPNKSFLSICIDAALEVDPVGFGQSKVSGVISDVLVHPIGRTFGLAVALGAQPDSLLLTDIVGPPDQPDAFDGVLDLVASVPEMNYLAIFSGLSFSGSYDGMYSEALFVNPGRHPRAAIAADFNKDSRNDLACIVDRDEGPFLVVLHTAAGVRGLFAAPREIPLPASRTWTSGRVKPSHMAVADIQADGSSDLIIATEPEEQFYMEPAEDETVWLGAGDKAEMSSSSVPLILSLRLESGRPVALQPVKSFPDLSVGSPLSGMAVGNFNGDQEPDLAIAIPETAADLCSGRTFDILVGGRKVNGLYNPLNIGTVGGPLTYYVIDGGLFPGHFRPMGGYFGLQKPSGILAARLNLGDQLDDIVLFAPEFSKPGEPDFQPHRVATYITRFDGDWNPCTSKSEVWFDLAPPHPLPAVKPQVCGEEELPEEYACLSALGDSADYAVNGLQPGQALPSDQTIQWEAGTGPVAGTTGEFSEVVVDPDNSCIDIMVANEVTSDATYIRGNCGIDGYQFLEPVHLFSVGKVPVAIQAADLDQDGRVDVVTALADNISIVYGYKGEFFEPPDYLPKGEEENLTPTSLVIEDVNNDNWDDLLVTSGGQSRILAYLNAGDREFFGPYSLPSGIQPRKLLVAQLDGDSCKDVAVLNGQSGTVTLLRNLRCD